MLINYLSKEKIFVHYLISESGILKDEYSIPNSTRRINLNYPRRSVFDAIEENHIDIFIDYFENDLKQDIVFKKVSMINKNYNTLYNFFTSRKMKVFFKGVIFVRNFNTMLFNSKNEMKYSGKRNFFFEYFFETNKMIS